MECACFFLFCFFFGSETQQVGLTREQVCLLLPVEGKMRCVFFFHELCQRLCVFFFNLLFSELFFNSSAFTFFYSALIIVYTSLSEVNSLFCHGIYLLRSAVYAVCVLLRNFDTFSVYVSPLHNVKKVVFAVCTLSPCTLSSAILVTVCFVGCRQAKLMRSALQVG